MTSGNSRKSDVRPYQRRFVYPLIAVMVLLIIALALGLRFSMQSRVRLCPPGNPDCGMTPPTPPPAR
jgi:lipopolysaccharide export LptBFGC system permease protein LptF